MPTQFQSHVERWRHCQLCPLSSQRTQIVLARGDVPCDVLLCGEAPGQSEDVLGLPFVGPAGKLLDEIVEQGITAVRPELTLGFANLVACYPRLAKKAKVNEPSTAEIKACSVRLREFVAICHPRMVVLVGKLSAKWAHLSVDMANPNLAIVEIAHPASILRLPIQNQGLAVQRCVVTLGDALEEMP